MKVLVKLEIYLFQREMSPTLTEILHSFFSDGTTCNNWEISLILVIYSDKTSLRLFKEVRDFKHSLKPWIPVSVNLLHLSTSLSLSHDKVPLLWCFCKKKLLFLWSKHEKHFLMEKILRWERVKRKFKLNSHWKSDKSKVFKEERFWKPPSNPCIPCPVNFSHL